MGRELKQPPAAAAKELLLSALQDSMKSESPDEWCEIAVAAQVGLGLATLAVVEELKMIREHLTGVNGE